MQGQPKFDIGGSCHSDHNFFVAGSHLILLINSFPVAQLAYRELEKQQFKTNKKRDYVNIFHGIWTMSQS